MKFNHLVEINMPDNPLVMMITREQLQSFLKPWMQALRAIKTRVGWTLEVDPIDI